MFTLKTMIISRFIIRLPLAWVLGIYLGWGLSGVWLAMSTDFLLRGFVFAIHTRQGRWRTIEV
jgi:Na+-driven multidrug efflux pump